MNLLAYADDIVLLSPSWCGLQKLLNIIEKAAAAVEMSFNTNKTVCMVANTYERSRYVSNFKYLGRIIEHTFCDDSDVNRELRNVFARVNVLIRRFSYCSTQVKLRLFKSYCLCYYDIALWQNYHVSVDNMLTSAYVKCMKLSLAFRNMVVFQLCLCN